MNITLEQRNIINQLKEKEETYLLDNLAEPKYADLDQSFIDEMIDPKFKGPFSIDKAKKKFSNREELETYAIQILHQKYNRDERQITEFFNDCMITENCHYWRMLVEGTDKQFLQDAFSKIQWRDKHGNQVYRLDFRSNLDIQNMDLKPRKQLHPLVIESGYTFLYGPTGAGKSLFCFGLLEAMLNNKPDWAGYDIVNKANKVLYIEGEMAAQEIKERVETLTDLEPGQFDVYARNLNHNPLHGDLDINDQVFQNSIKYAVDKNGYDVIILDSLQYLALGVNEDKSSDFVNINRFISDLKGLGCSVILVHHTGNDPKRQRGTSAHKDGADIVVRLEPKKTTKERTTRIKAVVEKDRSGVVQTKDRIKTIEVTKSKDLFGKSTYRAAAPQSNPKDGLAELSEEKISEFTKISQLLNEGLKRKDIAKELDLPERTLYSRIKEMKNLNFILKNQDGTVTYSLLQ